MRLKDRLDWVFAQDLPAGQKLVLLHLAVVSSNASGDSWAAQETIAQACGMSVRAVRGHLKALRDNAALGVVRRVRSTRSGRSSDVYSIAAIAADGRGNAPADAGDDGVVSGQSDDSATGRFCRLRNRQILPLQPADSAGEQPNEHIYLLTSSSTDRSVSARSVYVQRLADDGFSLRSIHSPKALAMLDVWCGAGVSQEVVSQALAQAVSTLGGDMPKSPAYLGPIVSQILEGERNAASKSGGRGGRASGTAGIGDDLADAFRRQAASGAA
jgi:hypothetical protein